MASTPSSLAYLIPLSGPRLGDFELRPRAGGLLLGRQEQCDLRLPAAEEKVSRSHARLDFDGQQWRLADTRSRWGTFLNGVRLTPEREVPLNEGDLIRITPWTFTFSTVPHRRGLQSLDDLNEMQTMVRSVSPEEAKPMAGDLLALLLEATAGLHAAQDEQSLAKIILEEACRGTGLPNAALLRPVDAGGRFEVIASRLTSPQPTGQALFSRSLLAAAGKGVLAELAEGSAPQTSESIIQMRISAALCVPLMLGTSIAAYLYLDARDGSGKHPAPTLRPNSAAFCLALARMASLALANLKRIDVERRQALLDAELAAAAVAQKWIMPQRSGQVGDFRYIGESRPGQIVGGDFFDVIQLDEHRLAVALGDVTGKGVSAGVLMTAAQGFLHAALREHASAERVVTDLNRFICPRRPESKFLTLWVGLFDAETQRLSYVDAGHGYALLCRADGQLLSLAGEGDNFPIGVEEDFAYRARNIEFHPGDQALIISDGIVEQFGQPADLLSERAQFEMEGVRNALTEHRLLPDPVGALFDAVIRHARSEHLTDDATAVLVRG